MFECKMIVTKNGSSPSKENISSTFIDEIRRYTIELPATPGLNPITKELLLPKQSYEKVLNRVQDFLRDDSIASDVVALVEAIESEHTAILFTTALIAREE